MSHYKRDKVPRSLSNKPSEPAKRPSFMDSSNLLKARRPQIGLHSRLRVRIWSGSSTFHSQLSLQASHAHGSECSSAHSKDLQSNAAGFTVLVADLLCQPPLYPISSPRTRRLRIPTISSTSRSLSSYSLNFLDVAFTQSSPQRRVHSAFSLTSYFLFSPSLSSYSLNFLNVVFTPLALQHRIFSSFIYFRDPLTIYDGCHTSYHGHGHSSIVVGTSTLPSAYISFDSWF
jgi:hypothetical protein